MITAYLLIMVDSGAERKVIEELIEQDGILDADVVYGEYDVLAKIKLEDVSQLGDFILEKIRAIGGVNRTSTLIVSGD